MKGKRFIAISTGEGDDDDGGGGGGVVDHNQCGVH